MEGLLKFRGENMRILIICTGNTCRSPMAEGIFKALIKDNNLNIQVSSAGTFAFDGDKVSDHSVTGLKKKGMDISNHKSTLVYEDLVIEADIILAMANTHKQNIIKKFPKVKNKVFLLNEYAFGENRDILDPFGGSLRDYERARDEIYLAVEEIVRRLVNS